MANHIVRFSHREMYVVPGIDKEATHARAVKLTSGEDAEVKVVVHHHSARDECNPACVIYPKEVSTNDENKTAPAIHSA